MTADGYVPAGQDSAEAFRQRQEERKRRAAAEAAHRRYRNLLDGYNRRRHLAETMRRTQANIQAFVCGDPL